ncbi:MAG: hypothetical protein JJV93_02745 [Alphaproteobacteria bacterium]|nr:hypothetical protein [Alphaproteobacteria bacterium]MBL0718147.1 hypothetical protein [Alphaproteobacteria bacterium]
MTNTPKAKIKKSSVKPIARKTHPTIVRTKHVGNSVNIIGKEINNVVNTIGVQLIMKIWCWISFIYSFVLSLNFFITQYRELSYFYPKDTGQILYASMAVGVKTFTILMFSMLFMFIALFFFMKLHNKKLAKRKFPKILVSNIKISFFFSTFIGIFSYLDATNIFGRVYLVICQGQSFCLSSVDAMQYGFFVGIVTFFVSFFIISAIRSIYQQIMSVFYRE